jgi:uncharacterized repeat protein (TIGR02543 family)
MIAFKCKICGGNLELEQGERVSTCESCGSTHSLPNLNNDKVKNLYERANQLRRDHEFDKAMGMYETIVSEQPDDPEVYWSLVLCKYGVEYVEDPLTKQRVITTHRTLPQSVQVDSDYKKTIQLASEESKSLYQEEAKQIDSIQKGILAISTQEEPYDVFICYKETDQHGKRTIDSVLAQQLHDALIREGYKVFYARMTLKGKLGLAYEPYIYSALTTSKVMLVLGTKKDYFEAPWVRNEWNRFLTMMKTDKKKTLIPMYRDMEAYDLPEEFRVFQAQDLNQLGALQDLLYGIKRMIQGSESEEKIKENTPSGGLTSNVKNLIERVEIFLEDENWDSAFEYINRILDIDPKNSIAYLYQTCANFKIQNVDKLFKTVELEKILDDKAYIKAKRFAENDLISKLNKEEENRKDIDLDNALRAFNTELNRKIAKVEEQFQNSSQTEADCVGVLDFIRSDEFNNLPSIDEKIRFYSELKVEKETNRLAKTEQDNAETYEQITELLKKPSLQNYRTVERISSDMVSYKDVKALREFAINEKVKLEKIVNRKNTRSFLIVLISSLLLGSIYIFTRQFSISYIPSFIEYHNESSVGVNYSLSLTMSGNVYSWGANFSGELGDGTTTDRTRPTLITFSGLQAGETIHTVNGGSSHSLAVTSNGRVYAWGNNNNGQLGDETRTDRTRPTLITLSGLQAGETIHTVNAGSFHSLAVTSNGRVYAWGFNGFGHLGDGTTTERTRPTLITFSGLQAGETIHTVNAGSSHSLAVTSNGRVYAWGNNNNGQLGDETRTERTRPTLITFSGLQAGETIHTVNAGSSHSLAVTSNGRVYAWGFNGFGHLGDGTRTERTSPTLITFSGLQAGETIGSVDAGYSHSLAVTLNGRVYAWGNNFNGQLGDGTSTDRNSPTLITFSGLQAGETIGSVDAGYSHSLAVTSNGRGYAWGTNNNGQLGDGTTIQRNTPIILDTPNLFISQITDYYVMRFNQSINLPNPVLEGYVFEGWYMDEELSIPFSLTKMPGNDLLLYAKFTPIASQG